MVNPCVRYCYASLLDSLDLGGNSCLIRLNWCCEPAESEYQSAQVGQKMGIDAARMVERLDLVSVCTVNASLVCQGVLDEAWVMDYDYWMVRL